MHLSAVALGSTPETPLGIRWDLVDFGLEFRPGGIYSNNFKKYTQNLTTIGLQRIPLPPFLFSSSHYSKSYVSLKNRTVI